MRVVRYARRFCMIMQELSQISVYLYIPVRGRADVNSSGVGFFRAREYPAANTRVLRGLANLLSHSSLRIIDARKA